MLEINNLRIFNYESLMDILEEERILNFRNDFLKRYDKGNKEINRQAANILSSFRNQNNNQSRSKYPKAEAAEEPATETKEEIKKRLRRERKEKQEQINREYNEELAKHGIQYNSS
jgi:hypothetical protein